MRVRFHVDAQMEFEEARDWYAERTPVAAKQFVAEVLRVVKMVAEAPERWPLARRGTRRVLLRRFPFKVVYRYDEMKGEVLVIAVAHDKRRPEYWRARR
jgi:toxin ParE1/3/4